MTFYVTMTDNFMSGWGGAINRIAKYVVECDTIQQAQQIREAAERRGEMKRINIVTNRPRYNRRTHQVTRRHFNDLGGSWYE